jgi:hypothetical protein
MFGALAEFERSLIRERTQAGLAAARRVGRTGGRPPKLTDDDIEAAKAMLAYADIGVTQRVCPNHVLDVACLELIEKVRGLGIPARNLVAAVVADHVADDTLVSDLHTRKL